jgi:hypothetical protein
MRGAGYAPATARVPAQKGLGSLALIETARRYAPPGDPSLVELDKLSRRWIQKALTDGSDTPPSTQGAVALGTLRTARELSDGQENVGDGCRFRWQEGRTLRRAFRAAWGETQRLPAFRLKPCRVVVEAV